MLGRRVVTRLIAAGHRVSALSRSDITARRLAEEGAEPRSGDLFDPESVLRITRGSDAILHLATAIPTKSRPKPADWNLNDRIRREGTANLVAAAVEHRCKLYVQESVTFLYGHRHGEWVDETAPVASPLPLNVQSAADMEGIVSAAGSTRGLPYVILRFGTFYSSDSAHTAEIFGAIRRGLFPAFGGGKAYWDLISVDDAAGAVARTVGKAGSISGETLNVCDDEPVLYCDLVDFVAKRLGAKRPKRVPAFIGKLLAGSQAVDFLLASVRCRNERAKRVLGWRPEYPTYREGMEAEIVKWLEKGSAPRAAD